ncbi:MAG: adenylate cyclase [Hyphomicrobiaceae bacterium]
MISLRTIPVWLWLTLFVAWFANQLAGATTAVMIGLMSDVSPFAQEVRAQNLLYIDYWRFFAYTLIFSLILGFLWPLVRWFATPAEERLEPSLKMKRRAVSAPLGLAAAGYSAWLFSIPVFVTLTLVSFGRWSPVLVSQHILAPMVNGFLASVLMYLLADWIFRVMVVPHIFPNGGLADVPGTFHLGVTGRLSALVAAVGFVPLFTMLGLIRAAAVRRAAGESAEELLAELTEAGEITFAVYVALGFVLTWVVARFLTQPLTASARAIRRVRRGDLDVQIQAESADEVGVLADGVNDLVESLRERERILVTFGRVVEPAVRDHLLSGRYGGGGELRRATVLFIDLRGFTALSEQANPAQVVETLNEFFTVVTAWVRECGGFVDKFIGDALLVVFGLFDSAANEDADSGALSAVQCVVGLGERLEELNRRRESRGDRPLAVSVGVHTGEVVAGTIGSADRHEYTVIGDTVNVAARLQALSKDRGGGALVSEETYRPALAAGLVPGDETVVESVGLRGRAQVVRVYDVPLHRSPNKRTA